MDLAHFRERLHTYLVLAEKNQQGLAALLHLHPNVLSRKLNRTNNASFTHNEVKQLIRVLAEWRCFAWRSEIEQLLDWLDINPQNFLSEKEWQLPPFNTLAQNQPSAFHGESLPGKLRTTGPTASMNHAKPAAPNKRLPNNLPQPYSSFIGREHEIMEVVELLTSPDNPRLLTLTGVGGSGKTRLALAVIEKLLADSRFSGGIYFIPLENITKGDELISELANTLSLKDLPTKNQFEVLKTYLAEQPRLLVLDNFEQLVKAGPLLSELLKASAGSKFLVTSRVPLQLTLEQEYQVSPLPLPTREEMLNENNLDELKHYPAIALFILRAEVAKPGFALNAENKGTVLEICLKLDGLPLAIELAAARIRTFSPRNLLERLNLKLLSGGARDLATRQQTLRGTIDWSYNLLSEEEQALFTRLSIFAGGFTLEEAEEVCNNTKDELELGMETYEGVESLLLKNLLKRWEDKSGSNRYGMLQTILEYGQEKLRERNEYNRIAQSYSSFFIKLAKKIELQLKGGEQFAALQVFESEYDNLRSVLSRAIGQGPGAASLALKLAACLGDFWNLRGQLKEGRSYLEEVLNLSGGNDNAEVISSRAKALNILGIIAVRQGDHQIARSYFEASLSLSRESEDKSEMGFTLSKLNDLASDQGDIARALQYLHEIMEIAHECSDKRVIVATLHDLGIFYLFDIEDYAKARQYVEDSLALALKIGDKRGTTFGLNGLGHLVLFFEEDHTAALKYFEEGMAVSREIGDNRGIWYSQLSLGILAYKQENFDLAARYFEEGMALANEMGDRRSIYYCLRGLALSAVGSGENEKAHQFFKESQVLSNEIGAIFNLEKVYSKRQL